MKEQDSNVVQMPPRDLNTAAADVTAVATTIKDARSIAAALPTDFAELVKRVKALSDGVERLMAGLPKVVDPKTNAPVPVIGDEATAQRLTDFLAQLAGCGREIEKRRKETQKPYLDGKKAVDGWFKNMTAVIEKAVEIVKGVYDPWLNARADAMQAVELAKAEAARAEAARISEQATSDEDFQRALDLEREAQEAQAKADNSASIAGRTVGELGSIGYLKTDLTIEITDLSAVPDEFMSDARVQTVLKAVIAEYVRSGRHVETYGGDDKIPGVSVKRERSSVVRKPA